MPIYEFKCEACGHTKEILILKPSDLEGSHKMGCDKCKGTYKRIMSAPSDPVIHGFNAKNSYSQVKNGKKKKKDK